MSAALKTGRKATQGRLWEKQIAQGSLQLSGARHFPPRLWVQKPVDFSPVICTDPPQTSCEPRAPSVPAATSAPASLPSCSRTLAAGCPAALSLGQCLPLRPGGHAGGDTELQAQRVPWPGKRASATSTAPRTVALCITLVAPHSVPLQGARAQYQQLKPGARPQELTVTVNAVPHAHAP